jgi:hypothetical protein
MSRVSYLETPNGQLAIVHATPLQLQDHAAAQRLVKSMRGKLAGMPTVLRASDGDSVTVFGDSGLAYLAAKAEVEVLPIVELWAAHPSEHGPTNG